MNRSEILTAAQSIVSCDRETQYGPPEDSFQLIAQLWTAYLKHKLSGQPRCKLTSKDVAIMMILLKIARIENGKSHIDNWVDIAGYAACGGEIETEKDPD